MDSQSFVAAHEIRSVGRCECALWRLEFLLVAWHHHRKTRIFPIYNHKQHTHLMRGRTATQCLHAHLPPTTTFNNYISISAKKQKFSTLFFLLCRLSVLILLCPVPAGPANAGARQGTAAGGAGGGTAGWWQGVLGRSVRVAPVLTTGRAPVPPWPILA